MALKKRTGTKKVESADFDAFVSQGSTDVGEPAATPPTAPKKPRAASPSAATAPAWVQRAETAKKTESQPFRYNEAQHQLLKRAKQLENRDYSKILADIVWPALEEKYGAEVPLDGE